jgi:hypothetical protein
MEQLGECAADAAGRKKEPRKPVNLEPDPRSPVLQGELAERVERAEPPADIGERPVPP